MILEKLIKETSNGVGYITIPRELINKNITIIVNKKIIKEKKTNNYMIYLEKKYIGLKCYVDY